MQVRAGRYPGRANQGHRLPCRHSLALGDTQLAAVGIEALNSVAVVDLQIQPVVVVLADVLHRPGGKGTDGVPHLSADVHPVVEFILPVHRVVPVAIH